jgi:hypothetical protein
MHCEARFIRPAKAWVGIDCKQAYLLILTDRVKRYKSKRRECPRNVPKITALLLLVGSTSTIETT